MGVNSLWELLLPVGRRIDIDSLEGKVLAIDASIWLTQFLSVAQKLKEQNENYGNGPVHYLANTLKRLCKLRHGGIRPVLVFDGATPEIKRRELENRRKQRNKRKLNDGFENEESFQRAAKRLLASNVIKGANGKMMLKKKSSTKDDEDEEDEDFKRQMAEHERNFRKSSRDRTEQKEKNNTADSAADAEKKKNSADEDLARKLQEEEWQKQQKEQDIVDLLEDDAYLEGDEYAGADNDWDIPNPGQQQTSGEGTDSKEASKSNAFGSGGRRKNTAKKQAALDFASYHAGDGTKLAVTEVAHLNPDERTQVIEDARKNRYLASRKEYLKVAYDPEGLSQTQLRNYLKYTKLQQDISKMAKQAAKIQQKELLAQHDKGGEEVGQIIFEKVEDEEEDTEDAGFMKRPRPTAKQKQEQLERFKAQRLSLLQDTDDEGDDDDVAAAKEDDDWRGPRKQHQSGDTYFRRPAVLDEDDENEDDKQESPKATVKRVEATGGGFFVPVSEPVQLPNDSPKKKRIQLNDDDSDLEDVVDIAGDDDASVEEVTDSKPAAKSDAAIAQELHDEEVARAMQNQEDGGGGFFVDTGSTHDAGGIMPQPEVQFEKTVITIDSDDDDRKPAATATTRSNSDAAVTKGLQEIDYDDGGGGFLPSNLSLGQTNDAHPQSHQATDDSDEDDVDWEDGEGENDEDAGVDVTKDSPEPSSAQEDKIREQEKDQADSEEVDDVDWEDGGEKETNDDEIRLDRFGGNDWDAAQSSPSKKKELTAALEQAQATAANLTNWAGRAFRRALADQAAENGEAVPEAAKPKSVNIDTVVAERETHSTNNAVEVVRHDRKRQSDISTRRSVSAKKPAASKSTAAPKRSFDFMETLPTVDEYATMNAQSNVKNASANMDPMATGGITDEMRTEVMQLLRLFGIPYIVAPAEAEAQCVELERLGLVDGIVTEDSDAFVFGGKVVYKNLFKDQKYLEAYHAADAQEEMNLNRDSMVALALLLGGDYTEGIKGVGMVNAMEILLAFDVAEDCKEGLTRFRQWLDGFDPEDLVKGGDSKNKKDLGVSDDFHRQHRTARNRWIAPKYFPDDKVLNAYWNPVVDNSEERFSWGDPDLDGLIVFLNKQLGWPAEQTKTLINPIIERLKGTSMHQMRMDSFMKYEDGIKFADIRSKRLQSVLKAIKAHKKKTEKRKRNDTVNATEASEDDFGL